MRQITFIRNIWTEDKEKEKEMHINPQFSVDFTDSISEISSLNSHKSVFKI